MLGTRQLVVGRVDQLARDHQATRPRPPLIGRNAQRGAEQVVLLAGLGDQRELLVNDQEHLLNRVVGVRARHAEPAQSPPHLPVVAVEDPFQARAFGLSGGGHAVSSDSGMSTRRASDDRSELPPDRMGSARD
ncbi:MAG: hypothetical protein M3020_09660 [Myxococcota bacterium]|nr:hypothetical protein [Myxococcota bacterium]